MTLGVDDEVIDYKYLGRKVRKAGKQAFVNIPDVLTRVSYHGDVDEFEVEEGIAFSPCYKLAAYKQLDKGELKVCLNLAKAN